MPKKELKKHSRGRGFFFVKSLSIGMVISIMLLFAASFVNDAFSGEIFLHEALPFYDFGVRNLQSTQVLASEFPAYFSQETSEMENKEAQETDALAVKPQNNNSMPTVVGLNDVIIEYGTTEYHNVQEVFETHTLVQSNFDIEALRDPDILRNRMYIVDPRTVFLPEMFDIDRFLAEDMRINPQSLANGDPVVLIFHTHSTEFFTDSDIEDKFTGIVGVGAHLAKLLNEKGIGTIHLTQRFDFIDGRSHILGAYERQVPYIRRILEENPTIEVVIDLHRDGLPEGAPKLLTEINGRPTAQIMFFNGLSLRNEGGAAAPINTLPNPYLPYNLALSFQMQMTANDMFDNFTRRIYLNAFRYSLHFRPKSLLIEVGAQNNTFQEAINATYPLAEILAEVIYAH